MKTKRILLLWILLAGMILTATAQQLFSPITNSEGIITRDELRVAQQAGRIAPHPLALQAEQRGEVKGTFRNLHYELAPGVQRLTAAQKSQLQMSGEGLLTIPTRDGVFVPTPGMIYFDEESDLVFRPGETGGDELIMTRPQLHEVFRDLEIPRQEVPLTLANTVYAAPGLEASATGSGANYAISLQFDSVTYVLDSTKTSRCMLTLIGTVNLRQPRVEGFYSKNDGYSLIFKTDEQIDLRVRVGAKIADEKKILLWGTEIPAGTIGKGELGIYAVVNMEGEITLGADLQQSIDVGLGAKGGTCWFLPTSIRNASWFNHTCDVAFEAEAKLKAFAGLHCAATLQVKSYKVLDIYLRGGMEGTVESDLTTLSADVGVRMKAGGKVISEKFTLVDEYYSLWKLQKPDMAGFMITLEEVCALGDHVAGVIGRKQEGDQHAPYAGPLEVVVTRPNGAAERFTGTSDAEGHFLVKGIPLRKGDLVAIQPAGANNASPAVSPTLPFRGINLTAVDYYTGKAYGSVAAARSKYSTATTASPAGSSSRPSAIRGMIRQNVARGMAAMTHQEIIRRVEAFQAGLLAYRGPIGFSVREKQVSQLQAVTPGIGGTARTARNKASAASEKVREMRGMVDHPLGWFVVGNLDIRPGQEVKAVIELEGFTIESEWVESDGLMVSSILHEGMESERTVDSETLSALNSVVVVSAIRGDEPPRGTVMMLLGDDMPHAGILNSETIAAFPEAAHAISHIDTTVVLQPQPGADGTSIASSGPWSSRVQTNPGVLILPARNGRHPFERVSYQHKGVELGHSYLIDECHSCRSPEEVIDRAEQFGRLRQEGALQQLGRRLMKEQPRVRPLTGGTLRF